MTIFQRIYVMLIMVLALSGLNVARADTPVTLDGDVMPGSLIIGTAPQGSRVMVEGRNVRVSRAGQFLAGLGRNASGQLVINVTGPDGTSSDHRWAIASRDYDIQRIDGLPKKQVTPDPEVLERIGRESGLIKTARKNDGEIPYFAGGFQWPVTGRISGVFGSQRILNGEPRNPHNGVDIAAPEGTPVVAIGDGVVTLAHEDMFYTGKTVVLDHGHGLTSVYAHMSDIEVAVGETVAKGQPVGKVGQTGRSTGPHLHWGVTLFSTHLDPALLVGPMPSG